MAPADELDGAVGIRAQGLDDIRPLSQHLRLPMIGLIKVSGDDVFITSTLDDELAVVAAGATARWPRPSRRCTARAGALVMADCVAAEASTTVSPRGMPTPTSWEPRRGSRTRL
ncbi:hypothetical protein [Humibacter antri]